MAAPMDIEVGKPAGRQNTPKAGAPGGLAADPGADACCGVTRWMKFERAHPDDLYTCTCTSAPCCTSGTGLLIGRVIMAVYALWHTIQVWGWSDAQAFFYAFVYLTDWGALLVLIYFVLAVCMQIWGTKGADAGHAYSKGCLARGWSRGARVQSTMFEILFVLQFVVVVMYWVAIYDYTKEETYDLWFLNDISVHGFFFGFMLIELFIGRAQFWFRHFAITCIVAVVYMLVNMISTLDYKPVYSVMKWNDTGTLIIVVQCYVLLGVGFLLGWGLTALRDKVLCKRS